MHKPVETMELLNNRRAIWKQGFFVESSLSFCQNNAQLLGNGPTIMQLYAHFAYALVDADSDACTKLSLFSLTRKAPKGRQQDLFLQNFKTITLLTYSGQTVQIH